MRYDKSRFGDFENVPQGLFRYAIGTFRNHKTSNSLYLISRYGICIPYRDMRFEISHFSIEIPYPDLKRDRKTRPLSRNFKISCAETSDGRRAAFSVLDKDWI